MRRLCLFAALAVGVVAPAQPPAADPFKLPDLTAKEWKPVGDTGLKVWDVKVGTGPEVQAGANPLRVHYTGWLTDGKIFDSSKKRNASATFDLGKLIEGWKVGLPGVKAGGCRRLMIPPELAYKQRSDKPGIPPGSTLVFEVEAFGDPLKMPPLDAKEWANGPEGLKVWDLAVGTGAEVKPGDTVSCHYTGWTTDGKEFDSSVRRGNPTEFPLDGVVRGWTIGIPGMKEGGIRRLNIPWALAYGEAGRPPTIPPKADLIFDIEVRKVVK